MSVSNSECCWNFLALGREFSEAHWASRRPSPKISANIANQKSYLCSGPPACAGGCLGKNVVKFLVEYLLFHKLPGSSKSTSQQSLEPGMLVQATPSHTRMLGHPYHLLLDENWQCRKLMTCKGATRVRPQMPGGYTGHLLWPYSLASLLSSECLLAS